MQSPPVQTRCYFLWMQQAMSAFILVKTEAFPFTCTLRQNADYWTISQRTMMQSDDKLQQWWINVTIRSLILPSLAEQKVDSDCDKSEWAGFPLARFWVLKSLRFVAQKTLIKRSILLCLLCFNMECLFYFKLKSFRTRHFVTVTACITS